jgi:hypothetical protein
MFTVQWLLSWDRQKCPFSEKKKTKNDGASGLSTVTDDTSLDISDQGERNDTDTIMNQTTEDREQETVALVIMDTYSRLVRVIPCKKRGNVLPHILDTITVWGYKPTAIRCDNTCHGVSWHIATVSGKIPVLRYRGLYGAPMIFLGDRK